MHILGVSRTLPFHSIGGMQAIAWDIFREMVRQGHKVTVMTTSIPGYPADFEQDGVRVIALQDTKPEQYSSQWWKGSREAVIGLGISQIDGVVSISVAADGLFLLRKKGLKAPFLLQLHGTSWGELLSKWRTRQPLQILKSVKNLLWFFKDALIYRHFDELVLVGDVLDKQMRAFPTSLIASSRPTVVIRNGIDTSIFKSDTKLGLQTRARLGIPEYAQVMLFAARLHPQKGGIESLAAFHLLAADNPNLYFLVVGTGGAEPDMRASVAAMPLQIGARVHFTGSLPRHELPAMMNASDVFVFPSLRQEGLPMNVLEAIACGLPVVCAESMRDVFDPSLTIAYVAPQDAKALSAAISEQLVRNHRETELPLEYQLEHCVTQYLDRINIRRHA